MDRQSVWALDVCITCSRGCLRLRRAGNSAEPRVVVLLKGLTRTHVCTHTCTHTDTHTRQSSAECTFPNGSTQLEYLSVPASLCNEFWQHSQSQLTDPDFQDEGASEMFFSISSISWPKYYSGDCPFKENKPTKQNKTKHLFSFSSFALSSFLPPSLF